MKRTVESLHAELKLSIATLSTEAAVRVAATGENFDNLIEVHTQQQSTRKERKSSSTQRSANTLPITSITASS